MTGPDQPARTHYRPNRRDLEFVLLELLDRGRVLGVPPFPPELDTDAARTALAEVETLATGPLAASYPDAVAEPPVLDPATGIVHVGDAFRASFEAYRAAQWWRLDLPAELGGPPAPPSLRWAVQELVLGANPAIHMYTCGYVFAGLLHRLGTPDQRRLAALMVERGWGATMALTEDDAGSDLAAVRTTARPAGDGTWHLDGVKRFVSNGPHDLSDNVVHFVLARPEGAPAGTRGLSLFVVPQRHVDPATGEPGAPNGVRATRLERKLGLHASATCELVLGRHGAPAVGRLVGDEHAGMRQVFALIGDARMMVATKATAALSSGYLHALEHARRRRQGPDPARRGDPAAPRVPIVEHPDVARMLLGAKTFAEGLRALVLTAAAALDPDGDPARAELLLTVAKGYASERANEQLARAFQTVGGAAFTTDLPLEQYLRDVRVDTVYEGTTGVQALSLLRRQVERDGGRALGLLLDEVDRACLPPHGAHDDRLAAVRAALHAAASDLRAVVVLLAGTAASDPRTAAAHATPLLMAVGDVVLTWLLLRSADVATTRLAVLPDGHPDAPFYRGKLLVARHAGRSVLPSVHALRTAVESGPPLPAVLDPHDL